ncbi:hypothetical protein IMSHALPRED_007567 [Imshaugia aleurites]|uniref:Syntaxin n=1 Tax=Imshaugia aleurites TaxID=172621 RepID=A0A8H3EM62_9LECA|nr:hypothetical protein IMSHALPRED_007567 [Imshaugia aleurites]
MAQQVEISIPNTQNSSASKPYTLYNITLRLPLRSFTLQKRYSDFTTLHSLLTSEAGSAPPAPLPSKSWFTRTTSSPELTEERRKGLETYLTTINESDDERWRNTSAWRTFLNLPSNATSRSSTSTLHSAVTGPGGSQPITDPVVWLDHHRDLKAQLHDARLHLTRRDQAPTSHAQHEASAQAKKFLVRAGTMIQTLDTGLATLSSPSSWGAPRLGDGELRRRRDLLSSAKREKEGLENLLGAMVAKAAVDRTVADKADKTSLLGPSQPTTMAAAPSGRVLGRETGQTRALDNQGVLQLQKQLMRGQDEDVLVLARAVARQKELGVQIQEELVVQNEMLGMLDEDVTRVQGKMDVARKRIGKIS